MNLNDTYALSQGFFATFALIMAIGAQNAYVLRMGLARHHVLPVVVLCATSDALMVGLGVLGMGILVAQWPALVMVLTWGGALFLFAYAARAFRSAWRPGSLAVGAQPKPSLSGALLAAAAFTWLNPHAWLDTVVLLGGLGANHLESARWVFWGGSVAASATWFALLGFGARFLVPLFRRPQSWRVLDGLIGLGMTALGVGLLRG